MQLKGDYGRAISHGIAPNELSDVNNYPCKSGTAPLPLLAVIKTSSLSVKLVNWIMRYVTLRLAGYYSHMAPTDITAQ